MYEPTTEVPDFLTFADKNKSIVNEKVLQHPLQYPLQTTEMQDLLTFADKKK